MVDPGTVAVILQACSENHMEKEARTWLKLAVPGYLSVLDVAYAVYSYGMIFGDTAMVLCGGAYYLKDYVSLNNDREEMGPVFANTFNASMFASILTNMFSLELNNAFMYLALIPKQLEGLPEQLKSEIEEVITTALDKYGLRAESEEGRIII